MTTHTQVRLNKDGAQQIVWIPTENARVDNYVRVKVAGVWNDGWKVEEVWPAVRLPSEVIQERSRDFKSHRRATDI